MDNWVERRARREKNLKDTPAAWEAVRTAIDNCCNSYRANFSSIAEVSNQPENGHRILITVRFVVMPAIPRRISIEFARRENKIRATIDDGAAKVFDIDADTERPFISFRSKEISPDELTREVLEKALFEPPQLPAANWSGPPSSEWGS